MAHITNKKGTTQFQQKGQIFTRLSALIVVVVIVGFASCSSEKKTSDQVLTEEETPANGLQFTNWLKEYIPSQYPDVEVVDNKDWFQAVIPELDLTISWAFLPQEQLALKGVHGHYQGKSIFISEPTAYNWTNVPNVAYTKGVGYYLPSYDSSSMGGLEVAKLSVLQFRGGDASKFVKAMSKAWLSLSEEKIHPDVETKFAVWLKQYIPDNYENTTYDHHNDWMQVSIPDYNLILSWGPVTPTQTELREVEGLTEGESLFIAKQGEEDWTSLPGVKYYPGIGYYVANYSSSTMGNFKVRPVTIIQFSGDDASKFVDNMVDAHEKAPYISEYDFMYWVKDYVNATHPGLTFSYNGAWYQSTIPKDELTVTWGTMAKSQMPLKELHGLRKGKSIFIAKETKEDWDALPAIEFTPGVGYYVSDYDESTMGEFAVGSLTVIQFNGVDASKFVEDMNRAWLSSSKE
ncbi:MAG: hypothetical protein ACMVP2_25925 [Imperialibacter sp.]|uniref:hypothetical protein n=1 Tax=Imperialibacter sp. TaxID=2038411 RepID=UPI003A8A0B9E